MNNQSTGMAAQGLLRFMLYTDVNRRRATQVGTDIWVNREIVFGDTYSYGTEHELCFDELDSKPALYVVAMIPHLKQIAHPIGTDNLTPLQTVYLTTATLWPFFEPVDVDQLNTAMLPQ